MKTKQITTRTIWNTKTTIEKFLCEVEVMEVQDEKNRVQEVDIPNMIMSTRPQYLDLMIGLGQWPHYTTFDRRNYGKIINNKLVIGDLIIIGDFDRETRKIITSNTRKHKPDGENQ
jgi:hypothetical protein